jgi:hypothetical protein
VKRQVAAAVLVPVAASLLTGCVVATSSQDGGSGFGFVLLLLPVFLFAVVAFALRGRRRDRHDAEYGAGPVSRPSGGMLRAELSVLADDILRLEPQVTLRPEARDDFDAATHRYRVAQAALETTEPVDLVRVQRVVDEATWSMARARAMLDGRPVPAPPPTLQRPGSHGEPAVGLDDDDQPRYLSSSASFRSGWFGAGGGLIGGLLMGTMLGGFGGWVSEDDGYELDADGRTGDGDTEW